MLCFVIFVGFLMLTLGVALAVIGETPLIAGKRIPALRARLIGVVLVSFLPLALALHQATNLLFGVNAVPGLIVTALLFVLCWMAVFVLLFRVMLPKKERPKPAPATPKTIPIEIVAEGTPSKTEPPSWLEPAPPPKPAIKKVPRAKSPEPPIEEKNPFDFS